MVRVLQKHHCYICTALLAFVYVNGYFYTISHGEENIVILAFKFKVWSCALSMLLESLKMYPFKMP